jgi:hypothetical protein
MWSRSITKLRVIKRYGLIEGIWLQAKNSLGTITG